MLEGITNLLRSGFPIEIVMSHIFESATGTYELDAIHLTLSYHAASEAWNRSFGAEYFNGFDGKPMTDSNWEKTTRPLRRSGPFKRLLSLFPDDLAQNVRSKLAEARRTTMTWRQTRMFVDLGLDVTGDDMKRITNLRNNLLHNGYLLRRWHQLSADERQQRYDDISRLRRLAMFVLFRLTGYYGQFQDPLTYQPAEIPQRDGRSVRP